MLNASAKSANQQSKIKSRESAPLLLPVLLLQTAQIFAVYAAPQSETRHF